MSPRHHNAAINATADLAIIAPHRSEPGERFLPKIPAKVFSGYEALRKSGFAAVAIVIRSEDEAFTARTLRDLRRDPQFAPALIFVDGPLPEGEAALSDGPVPDDQAALASQIEDLRGRMSAISRDARNPNAPLLEFLLLRPSYVLEPTADWRHPRRYRYPLLEAMNDTDSDPEGWLRHLDELGMIERAGLEDRQRECDFCGSAHLSFIDRCPKCQSIDITEPLDDGECRCAQCHHAFPEGEVIARCVICDQTMAPDELRVHCIHAWRLSALGRHAAQGRRAVQAAAASAPGDERSYASHEQFVSKLDWVLKIARQQRNFCFSLFAMRLENAGAMHAALGRARTTTALDQFAQRVREPLAEADVATRPEPELIWFLITDSDARVLRKLHKLIQQLTDELAAQEGVGPCWRTVDLSVTSRDAAAQTTDSLLRRLSGALTPEAAAEEIVAEAARRPPPQAAAAVEDEDVEDEHADDEPPAITPTPRRGAPRTKAPEQGGRGRRIAPTVD